MHSKVYDCFCYFNEDMLLQLRLETLWEYVDYFIIVESLFTLSGKPKNRNFDPKEFKKYQSKIRYLLIKDYPFELSDPWKNERYQRNYISNGLFDAHPIDRIIISDIDEIPRPELIATFNAKRYIRADFEQFFYSYFLNNRCQTNNKPILWYGSKMTTFKHFKNFFSCAESVRAYKSFGRFRAPKRFFFKKLMVQTIKNGGWHFSWMSGINKIIQKLESYAHQEYNKPEFKNPKIIQEKIAAGIDFLNPKVQCEPQVIDQQFPKVLVENQEKYKKWITLTKL